jgi:3'-5' exoribonuclease
MAKMGSLFPEGLRPGEAQSKPAGEKRAPRAPISSLAPGQEVESVYLVQEATLRVARNGGRYIQAVIADRTGRLPARQWDATEKDYEAYRATGYVRVRARVETYQDRPQLVVQAVQAQDAKEVAAAEFLPVSRRDPAEMRAELDAVVAGLQDPDYRRLAEALFAPGELRTAFERSPAASSIHHAWLGGLMEHVLSACRTAQSVAEQRPFLNRDLLMTGVLLHDLGKTQELSSEAGFGYTDAGRLLGHVALGAILADRAIAGLPDFPPKKRDLILHLILSHHGTREFGSPVTPCTAEAVALHHLECLDAKVAGIQSVIEWEQENGNTGAWSDFARVVDGRIFLG